MGVLEFRPEGRNVFDEAVLHEDEGILCEAVFANEDWKSDLRGLCDGNLIRGRQLGGAGASGQPVNSKPYDDDKE